MTFRRQTALPNKDGRFPTEGGYRRIGAVVKTEGMGHLSYSPEADTTEKALLRATRAARTAYERGTAERRPVLREVYLYTLRALNAYIAVEPAPPAHEAESAFAVTDESSTADRQYRALMALCGLA